MDKQTQTKIRQTLTIKDDYNKHIIGSYQQQKDKQTISKQQETLTINKPSKILTIQQY